MDVNGVCISLKENVKPIAQPERRIPLSLESAVEEKLEELLKLGIIEKVTEYSPWQSQVSEVIEVSEFV